MQVTITYSQNGSSVTNPKNAGTYDVEVVLTSNTINADYQLVDANDKLINKVTGKLIIKPASLIIITDAATKVYGDANPAFKVIYDNFVNGDDATKLGGNLSFTTTATASSAVGSYDVTPSGLTSSNYDITFKKGTLSITKATLTVTANNVSRTYGDANPIFTGTVTGQKNAESFTATYNTTATVTSAVGDYNIVPSVSGTTISNYTVVPNNGTLTITQATPIVTVTPGTYTYNGTAQGPNSATNTGTGTSYTFNYSGTNGTNYGPSSTQPQNAGDYTVTATVAASADGNYKLASSSVTGFKINKADATIDVTPYTVTYDGEAHTATGTAKGVKDEPLAGLDLNGTTHTVAENYTDTWTFKDETGNYNDASNIVSNIISKANPTIVVTVGREDHIHTMVLNKRYKVLK